MRKIYWVGLLAFVLSACVNKEYSRQQSAFILFKTPTVRHADLGFIYDNDKEMKIELYSSGQAVLSLEISETHVCMSLLECMSKKSFNEEVLSGYYPEAILENIFRGAVIFDGKNLSKNRNGFTQSIQKKGKYAIEYRVFNKEIIFRDTINAIRIKIKKQQS